MVDLIRLILIHGMKIFLYKNSQDEISSLVSFMIKVDKLSPVLKTMANMLLLYQILYEQNTKVHYGISSFTTVDFDCH